MSAVKTHDLTANGFVKDEGYPVAYDKQFQLKTKHARTINAYPDELKALYGPLISLMEKIFFDTERNFCASHFVKNVPVKDRPQLLESVFGDQMVTVGDFTSFESHMRGLFSKIICYAMNHIAGPYMPPELRKIFNVHMLEVNQTLFKGTGVKTQVDQTLMSGAMWTSFANCMLSHFLVSYMRLKENFIDLPGHKLVDKYSTFVGFCEGDDSVTLGGAYLPVFQEVLGLKLKSEVKSHVGLTSFCGILKPLGVDALLTDPTKVLCRFFQIPYQYAQARDTKQRGLLRAKALSYYYQYSNCPIIGEFAFAVLKLTRGMTPDDGLLTYQQRIVFEECKGEKFYHRPPHVVSQTRDLMAELFDYDIPTQLYFESRFKSWGQGDKTAIVFPEHIFGAYIDYSSKKISFEETREYPSFVSRILPNPDIMVGLGVFSVAAFLAERPDLTGETEGVQQSASGKKLKFEKHKDFLVPWCSNFSFWENNLL